MNLSPFKSLLRGAMLCLGLAVLASAATPFAASASSGGILIQRETKPAKKAWVRDASSSGEIQLKLEAKLNGPGVFVFEGDTITYRHESDAEYPREVTVDDMPWDDLTQPFKIDYEMDIPKAVITSSNGPRTFKVRKSDGQFRIEIDDSIYTWPNYVIVVATKKQVERKNTSLSDLRIQRPPSDFGAPAMMWFPGMEAPKSGRPAFDEASGAAPKKVSPYQNDPDAPRFNPSYDYWGNSTTSNSEKKWEEGIANRSITLTGQFFGNGTFIFEGRTITYRHETREYPSMVQVNDAIWGMPTKPFLLPFDIETAEFTVKQTKGDRRLKVAKVGDNRFEIFVKDPEGPPGSSLCQYAVTITPGKPVKPKSKKSSAAKPQPQDKAVHIFSDGNTQEESPATTSQSQAKPASKAEQKTGPANIPGGSIPVEPDINDGRLTTPGDFSYNGYSDVVFARIEEDGTELEYRMDGDDLEKQGTLDPSVRLVCARDMDMDHRVDLVAWREVEGETGSSIEVGYGKSGKMDDWHVIGNLGVPEGVVWDVYCGNLTGRWNRNSILWHSPTLGAMGYWPDGQGVNSWVSIPGEFKAPEWQVLGLGDFTESLRSLRGAKKPRASVLFLRGSSIVGYVTPDDGKFTELGRLDEGWEIAAIGDFTKSGCDDLVVFHSKLRQVGLWENGRQSKWRSLGAFGAGTVIEGAGDYDSDNELDLLARQGDGAMGYYPKADLTRFVPFGYKKDSSWTVIP